jgi:predicted nucleic acid-binding protein
LSGYLLDTNVLSEVIKKRPEPSVLARLREVAPGSVFTSVVCVTELRYGARRRPGAEVLWERIAREVLSRVRVLPLGEREALRAGDVLADLEASGQPIGIELVLIGATALVGSLTVATRNVRHFRRLPGLAVESWWPRENRA